MPPKAMRFAPTVFLEGIELSVGTRGLIPGRTAPERDDVSVRVLHVEILRPPRCRPQRSENGCPTRNALLVKRLDAVHAGRRIEMLVLAPVLSFGAMLRRLFQMELQPIQLSNRVEPLPRIAERKAELLVVAHRALQVVDQELRDRKSTRLNSSHVEI